MSSQTRIKVTSSNGALRVNTEVLFPASGTNSAPGRNLPEELVPNQGTKKIYEEIWHQGDCYDLIPGGSLVIWSPEGRSYRNCKLTITNIIDVAVIYCDTHGYWKIFVVPTKDTGTDSPANVCVNVGPNEPDPSEEEGDPPAGSN